MNTHADKTQENKSQSVTNGESQLQSGGESTFQFVDNRPEAVAQRKLQEMANNSSQISQLRGFQAMANNSPQAQLTTQLQSMADNHSAQQQPIQKKENNTGLPDNLKSGIENLSGYSMSDVKVYRNSDKPAQLNAHAYAQGTDIHLASGQEKHLPHEAWHVVQQKQGKVKPTIQMKDKVKINDDSGLEKEADLMGAKALQTKLSEPESNTLTNPVSSEKTVQRRIGFEIETGIPITELIANPDPLTAGAHPHVFRDAHPQTMAQNVRQGSLVISADHTAAHTNTVTEPFNQWSIIEGVTDPIDDSMGINAFDATATVWLSKLINIKRQAQAGPPAQQLLGSNYYVGLPSAQAYNDWDRIAPQVTVGVPLDQAGKLISQFPLSGTASAFNATQLAQQAPAKALSVMQQLILAIPPYYDDGREELKGLVTLMMNYLTAGNDDHIARVIYMKNRPANVFYKSKLSDVRNNLLNFNYGYQILNSAMGRDALRVLLLVESGRTAGDPLFKADPDPIAPQGVASNVTVHAWITEVLGGVDDRIFDEMKNPWANEIDPDANDEVVIELRKRAFNLTHNNFTLEDFGNGLLEYMKKVYLANKAIKNHED